jgi:large subunit ribosomal protein L17
MRHRKKNNHLSRTSAHRKAMLANMASSLIIQKRITTTTAKAKELRTFVEPIITRSKEDSTHSRRMVFKHLRDKYAVSELFREVATKVGERPGGYTRIIKLGNRLGDNADMCIIELVDYNENMLVEKAAAKPKTARRRRSGKKKEAGEIPAAVAEAESLDTQESKETGDSEASESVAEAATETPAETANDETPETEPEAEASDTPEAKASEAKAPETDEIPPDEDEDREEKKAE